MGMLECMSVMRKVEKKGIEQTSKTGCKVIRVLPKPSKITTKLIQSLRIRY